MPLFLSVSGRLEGQLFFIYGAYEIHVTDAERAGQFVGAYDRRIASALLEAAYVLLAEAGKVRQLLLGQTFLLPDSFNVPPDQPQSWPCPVIHRFFYACGLSHLCRVIVTCDGAARQGPRGRNQIAGNGAAQ